MVKTTKGRIIIPSGALVQQHELNVATILAETGEDVRFIPVSNNYATPDIECMGLEWEIKSPRGSSSRTIENNIRLALKQSKNIIIDLSRLGMPEDKCLREIERQNKMVRGKHRIMVITKNKNIIKLY